MQPRKRVLIVDDDGDFREALRDALQTEGYETAEAGDGFEALDYQRTSPAPGMILLDWNMAPMNGAAFLEELAKEPSTPRVPIFVLSADTRIKSDVIRRGLAGFVAKPVALAALLDIVARYCS